MINIYNLSNITNDEKSLLRCIADKLDTLVSETREAFNDVSSIIDDHYYVIGNYSVTGSIIKKLMFNDYDSEFQFDSIPALNVLTNHIENVPWTVISDSLSDATQGADVIITALRSAVADGVSNVSDFFGVFNTKINHTITNLTSNSKNIISSICNYISACGDSVSTGIASFMKTLQVTLGENGDIEYEASQYLGVNPFISGFSHIDALEIVTNVTSVAVSIITTAAWGAVGLLVSSVFKLALDVINFVMKAITGPVDVYTRNQNAKAIFDKSGHDITVPVVTVNAEMNQYGRKFWGFSQNFRVGDHYVFYFPGFELHVLKTQEGGETLADQYITVRVVKYNLSTPTGDAINTANVVSKYTQALRDGLTADAATQQISNLATTGVIDINQDMQEYRLWYWATSTTHDIACLNAIYSYNDESYLGNGGLIRVNQLFSLFNNVSPDSANNIWFSTTGANSELQFLSLGRGTKGFDPDYNYTNADWFQTFYTRHEKGKPTCSDYYSWCDVSYTDLIKAAAGFPQGDYGTMSDYAQNADRATFQLKSDFFFMNLAGLCMLGLTKVGSEWKDEAWYTAVMNKISDITWFNTNWPWELNYNEERGAYAIFTDEQNAQRAGKIYTAMILVTATLTAAITAGVIKGALKRKAYSESRKLDIMAFDETKTDKECRFQNMRANFWAALAGNGTLTSDTMSSGQSLLDSINLCLDSRTTTADVDSNTDDVISNINRIGSYIKR